MDWGAVGAIGEITGAMAVVVSLVYLGRQIREGARASQAQTELEAARMWSDYHARVAHSPDMTRIWDLGHTKPDAMSDQDRQRFVWLIAEYFFLVEGLFKQKRRGFISPGTWASHERTIAGVLENEIVRTWWDSGVSPFSDVFSRHVNGLIERPLSSTWAYTPLAELGGVAEDPGGQANST